MRKDTSSTTPQILSIHLLGPPIIKLDDRDVLAQIRYRRSLEVLTYLAVEHDRWHSRAALADMFWPDLDLVAGRTNLRQVIADLNNLFRQAESAEVFQTTREAIGLFPNDRINLDTLRFESGCLQPTTQILESDDQCVSHLYRGPLLDIGGDENHASGFREWLEVQRQSFLLYAIGLIEKQCELALVDQDNDRALVHAQRLISLEPSQESAHARLIRLLAQTGQKSAAIHQFERLKTHLANTLDAQPSLEMLQLVEDIQLDRFPVNQPTEVRPLDTLSRPGRERRLLSCLYCEFHPELGSDSDEELILEKLVEIRRESTGVIRKYHGFVSDLHGSGLFAYFGFPKARERASVLAVQAAQEIRSKLPSDVQPRIGIYSGSLLIDLEQGLPDVFGQASELAMRLRLIGEIGDITVDETTHMAAWRVFPFESMAARQFRGMDQTVRSWRVARSHVALSNSTPNTQHLVGREQELRVLLNRWHEVCAGSFRCVMVEGIAGIGKTRLVNELVTHALRDGAALRTLSCLPEYQSSPLTPIKRLFEQLTGFNNLDEHSTRMEQLHQWFDEHWPSVDSDGRQIVMDILQGSDQQIQAKALFHLLTRRAKEVAVQQPLLIVFEDIHWLDRTSLAMLRYFLPTVIMADVPIMLVLTRRSGYQDQSLSPQIEPIQLAPLPPCAAEAFLTALDKHARLAPSARQKLTYRSAGIPLFIEELYHFQKNKITVTEPTSDDDGLPASLQLLLQAEIDELGGSKYLLMTASAIGHQFRLETLLILVDEMAEVLEETLQLFCRRNLLQYGNGTYHFRHDMIRETAYQMLPVRRRQELHCRIAESLIIDQRTRDDVPELIAHHFEHANDPLTAIRWWHHAGRHAVRRQAELDAHAHFERAHQLMDEHDLPKAKRLDLILDFSESLIAVEGYGSSQARDMLIQALALAEVQQDTDAQFRALSGIWLGDSARDSHEQSLLTAQRLQALAQDDLQRHTANFALGNASFWCGAFAEAVDCLQKVSTVRVEVEEEDRNFMVDRPSGSAQAILCWALWFVDRPNDARAIFESSLANARRLKLHRLSCYTLVYGANLLRCLGDVEGTAAAAKQLLHLADNDHFQLWQDLGTLMQAWADAHGGTSLDRRQLHLNLDQIMSAYQSSGIAVTLRGIVAEIHISQNDLPEALRTLDQAVEQLRETNGKFFAAEIHRLRAVCLAGLGTIFPDQVEKDLNQAIAFAYDQKSPPLLRRAHVSQKRWEDGETDLLDPNELLAQSRRKRELLDA